MASLLRRVKARVALASSRKTLHPLEGAHAAVRRGRSLDFDDLRHYEPGDEVRDIDWRATARQGQLLVKQYVATRRYSLALAVDTSPRMSALAADGTSSPLRSERNPSTPAASTARSRLGVPSAARADIRGEVSTASARL